MRNLLGVIDGRGVRLVHLSIDLVFSGDRDSDRARGDSARGESARGDGGYREHDPPDPVTVYGATMVAAERLIQLAAPRACILRISLPMGVSFNGHAGAIDWIQSRFRKSKPATLYYDEVRTPTYTDCLSELCDAVLGSTLGGLYHAGGPQPLSLYQIAQIVNRVGGYAPDLLRGCPRREAGPIPPRAGNVTLDSSKLHAALGYRPFDPWPLDERWLPTGPDWHRQRSDDQSGSPELLARVLYRNPRRLAAVAAAAAAGC